MKLILITTPEYFVEEDQILNALFEEGLDTLHLRKPGTEAVYAERLLTLIPEKYHKKIVIHDHFYLCNEYKLKGIHLNSRNPIAPDNYSGHISASCHTLEEVQEDKKTCGRQENLRLCIPKSDIRQYLKRGLFFKIHS